MRFVAVFLTLCVLGSAVAHPGWLSSKVGNTANALRETANKAADTAVSASKSTTNMAVSAAKSTTNTAVSAAKATTNVALNAAETAKNMTVNTAAAGVNMVKNISMSVINSGIGFLIQEVKKIVRRTGKNSINIPDIYQKAGPISFNATKGYFKDITTIVQDGKANVTTNGTTVRIAFPLKMTAIDIGYEQFNMTVNLAITKMNGGGGIRINIKDNGFIVRLSAKLGRDCMMNVEKVDVVTLAGYDIDFTNVGTTTEWVLEKGGDLIVNAVKGQIKSKVQEAVDSSLKAALKENGAICSKFLG